MILRPHHLLCTLLYCNNGYSENFCINMKKVIAQLNNNPDFELKIISDDICIECPNNKDGECSSGNENVIKRDRTALETLSLTEGVYNYKDVLNKIRNNLSPELFEKICGGCVWHEEGYCTYGILCERLFP